MSKPLPIKEIIVAAGGNSHIARKIAEELTRRAGEPRTYTPQAVSMWDVVPIDHVGIVSALSNIPRHLIRPDRPDLFPPPKKEQAA